MEKIILTQPHTHAGEPHEVGAELTVLLHDAEWLIARGIARFVPGVFKRNAIPPPLLDSAPAAPGDGETPARRHLIATRPPLDLTGATP